MSKTKRRRGDIYVKRAWEYISGGMGYEAREEMSKLYDKCPERADKETALIFAWSFEVDGRSFKAEDWTRNILERHPDYIEAWELLAHLLSEMEDRQEELQEVVDHLLELQPNSASALRSLASGYYNRSQYDEAIKIYQKVAELYPDDSLSWDNLAHTLNWAERYEESLECWRKVLEIEPENERARHWIDDLEEKLSRK